MADAPTREGVINVVAAGLHLEIAAHALDALATWADGSVWDVQDLSDVCPYEDPYCRERLVGALVVLGVLDIVT